MAKKDEEINTTFIIPQNFTDSGKILGMFKARNFAEAVIFAGLPAYFIWGTLLPLAGIIPTICITIFLVVPVFIFCIMGINEDALTLFLQHVLAFLKNRKKMRFKRIRTYRVVQRVQGNAGVSGKRKRPNSNKNVKGGRDNASRTTYKALFHTNPSKEFSAKQIGEASGNILREACFAKRSTVSEAETACEKEKICAFPNFFAKPKKHIENNLSEAAVIQKYHLAQWKEPPKERHHTRLHRCHRYCPREVQPNALHGFGR